MAAVQTHKVKGVENVMQSSSSGDLSSIKGGKLQHVVVSTLGKCQFIFTAAAYLTNDARSLEVIT